MAANATDLRLYYSQILGPTLLLKVGVLAVQTSDDAGELPEGRYLVRAIELAGRCWIKTSKFTKGVAPDIIAPVIGAMAFGDTLFSEQYPLDTTDDGRSIVLVVRGHNNGRIQAIGEGGNAVLAITRVGDGAA